ncbi:MAG: hypothetical protein O3C40_32645 [Planctomycetota bacterium]|nr:hypothetical protein [Planctomycetota bacterium]
MVSITEVKQAATGHWREILERVGGIDRELLDGKGHPCPKCGGSNRFSLVDEQDGAVLCRKCFKTRNGDGVAAIGWRKDCDLPSSLSLIAAYLGITNGNGNGHKPTKREFFNEVCALKRMPTESAIAYGAQVAKHGKLPVVRFPVVNENGECHSYFDVPNDKNKKGWCKEGKGNSGLFLPHQHGAPKLPRPGEAWVLCEGVKDATAYHSLAYLACGLPGDVMAEKYAQLFSGCHVAIMPDRTTDAEAKAQTSAARLHGVAKSIRIGTLPLEIDGGKGDDARDVLALPGGAELLKRAVRDSVVWQPSAAPTAETSKEVYGVKNYTEVEQDEGEPLKVPLQMREIIATINAKMNGWPRRVGQSLFIDARGRIDWLERTPAIFGWLQSADYVFWRQGDGYVGKQELHAELSRTADNYVGIAELPHEPRFSDHYYACGDVEPGDGETLRALIDRFSPATEIDRDLILSAFLTPGWGGPTGCRPCFVVTSDDGRGAGKTTIAKCVGLVWGGLLTFSHNEDINKIKTRLLSPDALPRRIALLDNVKSHKFSWAELEGLITAPTIGGHKMYVGEATRPNLLTWFVTLNGASLATDMAQRSVIIKVKRPSRSAAWEEDTTRFIVDHQWAIVADIVAALRAEPFGLARFTRWATWEKDVLQRLPEPEEAQRVILERQAAVDVEADEAELIEEYFAEQLDGLTYRSDLDHVFVPSAIATRWFNAATNDNAKAIPVGRMIGQMIDEDRIKRLRRNKCLTWGRGFVWIGSEEASDEAVRTDIDERIQQLQRPKW